MLENMNYISSVEQGILLVPLLTRDISWLTLEINFIFPSTIIIIIAVWNVWMPVT